MNKVSTFCALLLGIPSLLNAQATTGNIPYAKKLLNADGSLKVWTMGMIDNDKTLTINPGGNTIEEKDIRSKSNMLGYSSLTVEKDDTANNKADTSKKFSGTLDLTNTVLPAKIAILVDDIAVLRIEEILAERKVGIEGPVFSDTFSVNGTALWNPRSYKEYSTSLPVGRKYNLHLTYSNTANLTQKYGGKIDVDGVSVYVSLLPVEVIIPKLDSSGNQIDGEFVNANELKVAKWEEAFEGNGTNGSGSVKDDFISLDKDRFYIRIRNGLAMGIEAIKVATEDCPDSSYNDDSTRVSFYTDGTDVISDSMILVSDDEDDDYAGSGAGADDQDDDRTHKVQLGGKFVIKSIFINGTEHDVNIRIPVPAKKQVDIKFYRFDFAGSATEQSIRDSMKWVKERYAQAGLEINATYNEVEWPNIDGTDGPGKMTIYGNFAADPSLRQVYYDFIDSVPNSGVCLYNVIYAYSSAGVAVTMSQIALEDEIELKYLNKAFVHSFPLPTTGVATANWATAAHELLHVLAPKEEGDDHDEFFPNILVTPGQNVYGDHRSRKRINSEQESRIYNHINVEEVE